MKTIPETKKKTKRHTRAELERRYAAIEAPEPVSIDEVIDGRHGMVGQYAGWLGRHLDALEIALEGINDYGGAELDARTIIADMRAMRAMMFREAGVGVGKLPFGGSARGA